MEVGEREIIYLSLHCHHQNNFCIKVGSDESHFNISVGSDGQSHRAVSTNHNLLEEKGEPERIRTKVLPLTSLITPLPLGQTGSQVSLAPVKASVMQAPAVWLCAERAKHDRCRVRLAVLLSAGYSCVTWDWSTQ